MIKRFTSQEIFIILAALFVLFFMYLTIIISASPIEASDLHDEVELTVASAEFKSMSEQTSHKSRFLAVNSNDESNNDE
ncbi:hypothetical protein ACFFHM_09930 [Halalkalibacter kiskunsagensis]|uniref:Uncharacterized protein n=1 Tax=Halalkalibacter kiskunsagensis TaxID=1548599 RepID=A0ABV6KBW6_9BACI